MSLSLKTEESKKYTKNEILLIIREYVYEQEELSRREMLEKDNFGKAGWSEYQAFQLGIQKMCSKLEAFIPTPEKE